MSNSLIISKMKNKARLHIKKQNFFTELYTEIDRLILAIPHIKDKKARRFYEDYLDYKIVILLLFLLGQELDNREEEREIAECERKMGIFMDTRPDF